ncbi:MAG: Dps family protein [Bacteroidota bacterium]
MTSQLINELNQLLSDFHIYYQNTRGFHWNIKGNNFFQLHTKFEELYTEALTVIDEVGERILTIGGQPLHTFDDYKATSKFKVYKNVSADKEIVAALISQLEGLVKQENVVKELATKDGDNETEDMMIALINAQQKTIWMLNAWMGQPVAQ